MKKLMLLISTFILILSLFVTVTVTLSETVNAKDIKLNQLPAVEDQNMCK